jgi:uncharacterized membrane protein YbaN (DUF454 family)
MSGAAANRVARPTNVAAVALAGSGTGSASLRCAWLAGGVLCLLIGTAGIVLPLVPTVDFYALAACCFARGSRRWEAWLLNHPRIGPLLRDWRASRAVPLRAKWLATLSMSLSCAWAFHALKPTLAWIPAACCALVALYLWTRPTRPAAIAPEA